MHIKRIIPITLLLSASAIVAEAQYLQDVLRYSQPEQGATARFRGLGNAQTALGGDLSSISGNPAGLGFFGQSDISISFDYLNDVNKAGYFGTSSQNAVDRLGISQVGAVFHIPTRRPRGNSLTSGWLNFNLGIGYAKTNNFNTKIGYSGENPSSTFAHFLADEIDYNGSMLGEFGYASYLVDFNGMNPNDTYHYPIALEGNNFQENIYTQTGTQSETNFSFGANYSNRFYIGASVGFAAFNYTSRQLFKELGYTKTVSDIHPDNPNSEFLDPASDANMILDAEYDLAYDFDQIARGRGINAKIGFIYKPLPYLNIGFTAASPTWYNVTDDTQELLDVLYYDNAQATEPFHEYYSSEDDGLYYLEYRLRTPYRLTGGLSAVLSQGLISADIEYVDYSSMHFSASDALPLSEKTRVDNDMADGIANTYTGAVNFRIGGEYLLADNLLARAGYGHNGSPYKDQKLTSQTVSGGLGYRHNNMYIDATYQHFSQSYENNPYTVSDWWGADVPTPAASVKNSRSSVFLTLGFKF
ncbi:hypothetical protein SAMN05421747_12040 [Parapedobacter composti]|uniref:Outer membrane protein transport protein (OMPP1/FadL/TodX) n=1 Tax=Parapedobacter composti TaxID=623281 RepID=A0A1I1LC54_9SPHI|nr:hypothetical protein [Parapedobacter composti]SFC70556.1 hypothetical protein SAMN05421747_12040 [Parapedobacter composti]